MALQFAFLRQISSIIIRLLISDHIEPEIPVTKEIYRRSLRCLMILRRYSIYCDPDKDQKRPYSLGFVGKE